MAVLVPVVMELLAVLVVGLLVVMVDLDQRVVE